MINVIKVRTSDANLHVEKQVITKVKFIQTSGNSWGLGTETKRRELVAQQLQNAIVFAVENGLKKEQALDLMLNLLDNKKQESCRAQIDEYLFAVYDDLVDTPMHL